ncbi:MAG: hypothetical protein ACI90V_011920, partial [Bacillariaceae sp.]
MKSNLFSYLFMTHIYLMDGASMAGLIYLVTFIVLVMHDGTTSLFILNSRKNVSLAYCYV